MKRIAVIATDGKFAGFLMQSIQRYILQACEERMARDAQHNETPES